MSALIFNNCQVNVAPSSYLKEQFELKGFYNVEYVPNTIELSNYQFFKRTFDKPKLLWVRSFSKIYNPLMAIKVLNQLKKLGLEASLCMIGPDSDGTMMEARNLSNELDLNVRFTGKLLKREWLELSKDYNIFINTANVDNTPISVIEAMALGLPVVSTNVGGMPFLIEKGKNGILVEQNNTDEMTHEIIKLFNDRAACKTLAINARFSSEQYDWQMVRLKWNEILRN
ncbi:glycosyltransferase family 4 protein [Subsaxibacter sp. CAU 1640]|uniref:glycosyltransferase family 4 protein n=1 Tax=Subsaxibacter sp. CAU 1640 TaxID=2933271 RepID=UPI00293EA330|nr:glycosyltransferase family 4 protein [Subsaxibacter sp. CAU 1640]